MPYMYRYECDICDFTMPPGLGSTIYAVNRDGQRIRCPHPREITTVEEITGLLFEEAMRQGRSGLLSYCVCTTCLQQGDYDLSRDSPWCPSCHAGEIYSANSLLDEDCPKCQMGTFNRIYTGVRS